VPAAGLPDIHVGHWLIGDGREAFEAAIGYRARSAASLARLMLRHAGHLYASGLTVLVLLGLVVPGAYLAMSGAGPLVWTLGIALSLLPASILAVAVVHWIVTLSVRPRVLPKLSFDKGIPPQYATAVVMPVLVAKESEVPALIERLEMHRLANADPSLQFALLSDHADASGERMPGDESVERRSSRVSGNSIASMAPAGARRFTFCIAVAATTTASVAGWPGSVSGASSNSSTALS
jgi:cyclic beta-1,2-glucan synthetase